MKKTYNAPEFDVTLLETNDVMTGSNSFTYQQGGGEGGSVGIDELL